MSLLSFSAFDLSEEELVQSTQDIISCLAQAATIVDRRKSLSAADYREALYAIKEALVPAYDDAAGDAVPWARSHLYLGHIARGLRKLPEAEDAYAEAASTLSDDPAEQHAAKEAAVNLRSLQRKRKDERRRGGIWEPQRPESSSPTTAAFGKTRSQRIREFLHTTWDPEGDLHVQKKSIISRPPVTVTPSRLMLNRFANWEAAANDGPPRLRRTSGSQVCSPI